MKYTYFFSVLCACFFYPFASVNAKSYDVTIDNNVFNDDPSNYVYSGAVITSNLEDIVAFSSQEIQKKIDGDAVSKGALLFLNAWLGNAYSTLYLHEKAHMAHLGLMGADDLYYVNKSGQRISDFEAFLNILKTGGVGGPATGYFSSGIQPSPKSDEHYYEAAGINAQIDYARDWYFENLINSKNDYQFANYIANKTEMASYAYLDLNVDNAQAAGDIDDLVRIIREKGFNVSNRKIFELSVASLFLSPAIYRLPEGYFDLNGHKFSYDINNYIYSDAVSTDVRLYGSSLILGHEAHYFIGIEDGSYGENFKEWEAGISIENDKYGILLAHNFNSKGGFSDIQIERKLSNRVSYYGNLLIGNGAITREEIRKLPTKGREKLSIGVRYSW